MFLIVPVLVLYLASVYVQSKPRLGAYHEKLRPQMRETFEKVNKKYNDKMKWNDEFAEEAFKEAITPEDSKSRWTLKLQGTEGRFDNADKLAKRVKEVLRKKLEEKGLGQKVANLPSGTEYGCGGFVNNMGPRGPILQVACLYNSTKST